MPSDPKCSPQFSPRPECQAYYRVGSEDSLYTISLRYGVTIWRIAEANSIFNVNQVRAGDVLCIPADPGAADPEAVVLELYGHYTDTAKTRMYFTDAGWKRVGACESGQCGCTSPPSQVVRVRVTDLQRWRYENREEAILLAEVICELQGAVEDPPVRVIWFVVREDGRWLLDDAAAIPLNVVEKTSP